MLPSMYASPGQRVQALTCVQVEQTGSSRAVMERLGFCHSQDFILEEGGEPFALYILARPS